MISISSPYMPNKKKYQSLVDDIYASGWITNNGPMVQRLESALQSYLGVKNLVLVTNGTVALQIAYRALDLTGDVLTTPFSYIATASSLAWQNLRPVYSDIDASTLNLDPALLERAITEKTSAILPVHVFGNACEVDAIEEIGSRNNIPVIYDAAHTFGVKLNGESLLKRGTISTLSFHATKLFHTIEGGAIMTDDDNLAAKIRRLRDFGIDTDRSIVDVGVNGRMNEFSAAMGLCVLDEIDQILTAREEIYDKYSALISDKIMRPTWAAGCTRNWHYYPLIFDSEKTLLNVVSKLEKIGVSPRRYFYPSLESIPVLGGVGDVPVSADIASRILCVPLYPGLKDENIDMISATVNNAAGV